MKKRDIDLNHLKIVEKNNSLKVTTSYFLSNKSGSWPWHNGINNRIFFCFIFIYHIFLTFQGVDFYDEGFHATFYQRIFDDPGSVSYSFFYWFSGIIGGFILKMAPGLGLWGLRLAGAVVSTSTILVAYQLLKDKISRATFQISIILLAFYINIDPKDIYYNTLSSLLYFLSALFIIRGLEKSNNILIFTSGIVISLNTFTRLPNILGVGFLIIIIFYGLITEWNYKIVFKRIGYFLLGFCLTTIVMVGIIYKMGHHVVFINSIKFLYSLATTSGKQDGLEGSYSILRLIYIPLKQHLISLSLIFLIIGFLFFLRKLIDETAKFNKKYSKISIEQIIWFSISAITLALILIDKIRLWELTYFFTGISTITSIVFLLGNYEPDKKLLVFTGLFIMIVHPLGSSPGIMSVIIYSMWVNFPMAISMVKGLTYNSIELKSELRSGIEDWIVLRGEFLKKVLGWFAFLIVITCVRHIFVFPYFYDKHFRTDMYSVIHNRNMKFIYTSGPRAKAINELLDASEKYVKKGDVVLAYDAIPLYHFMTETRPYLPCSAPSFYVNSQFNAELNEAKKSNKLPVVVQQRIWFIFEGSGWPEKLADIDYFELPRNKVRNEIFNEFILTNGYKEVWSNQYFRIMIPPKGVEK